MRILFALAFVLVVLSYVPRAGAESERVNESSHGLGIAGQIWGAITAVELADHASTR